MGGLPCNCSGEGGVPGTRRPQPQESPRKISPLTQGQSPKELSAGCWQLSQVNRSPEQRPKQAAY